MKPRSKWLFILLSAALIAATGSFVFVDQQRQAAGEAAHTEVAPDAQKPDSAVAADQAEDLTAPPNALRFVRGDDAEDVRVSVVVGTPGHYPPREGEVEKGGFFELPELLETSNGSVNTHEVFVRSQDNKDAFWSYLSASPNDAQAQLVALRRSEERRVGKECRSRWS